MRNTIWPKFLWVPIIFFFLGTANAEAWWQDQWQYRQKITIDTTLTAADLKSNLENFPLLVRLHSGNFKFGNANDAGEDIRFVSANDQDLLKHHIEKFDNIDEIAYIWVKLPKITANASQDFIWMYYGNKAATGGQDSAGTFDTNYVAVFHLGEIEGKPQDATTYHHNAAQFNGGQGLPSVVGSGITLSGGGDKIVLTSSPALELNQAFTFSAWMRIRQPQQAATLFARQSTEKGGILIQMDGTKACFQIAAEDGQVFRTQECLDLSLNAWHHVAFTAASQNKMAMYLDGQELFSLDLPAELPKLNADIHIGASADGTGFFVGDLDEIRLSNISRSADWIGAIFKSQGPDSSLVQLGMEESGGGSTLPVFYLATVLKNITLDGWIVIGCLGILAFASWVVFINKAFLVWAVSKENTAFKSTYKTITDPTIYEKKADQYPNSSLYRIFSSGCEALNRSLAKNGHSPENLNKDCATKKSMSVLDSRSINSIKAALERGFIEESQRLNARLVLLTMAITGGPFLGLLGTVWGVMNTFAAMAEAGEANIMAIAPGVASALSTTVIGLIVAIPALFAYNYLTGRIKTIMADMMITVDQFGVNIDEVYGAAK